MNRKESIEELERNLSFAHSIFGCRKSLTFTLNYFFLLNLAKEISFVLLKALCDHSKLSFIRRLFHPKNKF